MAQEKPNRLAEWLLLLRAQAPLVRQRFEAWLEAVREEPRLIWHTPAIRYAIYGAGGLAALWLVSTFAGALAPPPPAGARPEATSADFHVVCTDRECGAHFVIHRAFGFDDFPVRCPKCEKRTGHAARRCNSSTCNGRWVAPVVSEGRATCPRCGQALD